LELILYYYLRHSRPLQRNKSRAKLLNLNKKSSPQGECNGAQKSSGEAEHKHADRIKRETPTGRLKESRGQAIKKLKSKTGNPKIKGTQM
jgi:hypothetical protein